MEIRAYQLEASKTDRLGVSSGSESDVARIVPLLGLAGEVGELLSEYKKRLRDGEAHPLFRERIVEELGDLLWYLANVATKFELDLGRIAEKNLQKVRERWGSVRAEPSAGFDSEYVVEERLPKVLEVDFREIVVDGRVKMRLLMDGHPTGNDLTDNAHDDDGYRFHDVFHLSFAAVLGWSPVLRKLLNRKRKSNPVVDEVEDGARAAAIEEGLSAVLFEYARNHNYLDGVSALDYDLLRTVKGVTSNLEVSNCGIGDWEKAIMQGFEVWRQLNANRGGRVLADASAHELRYLGPSISQE